MTHDARRYVVGVNPGTPPPQTDGIAHLNQARRDERQRMLDALAAWGGNQTRAAESLGMPRRTFVSKLDRYGFPRPRKRETPTSSMPTVDSESSRRATQPAIPLGDSEEEA
jgi:hypothetical protein